jgi:transcriptional regulator with XRE-family HTH domain
MIGPLLRRERLAQGQTLEGLARRTGIAASNLSRLERPDSNPRISTVHRVVRGLGLVLKVEPAATTTLQEIEIRMAEGASRLDRVGRTQRDAASRLAWKAQRGIDTDVEERLLSGR